MRHKIVMLDRATIGPNIKIRKPDFAHDWQEYEKTSPEQLGARIAEATIVITNKVPLGTEALALAPDLKLIAIAATGYNLIDLETCQARHIAVSNIRHYANHTVPEHVLTLALMLFRQIKLYEQELQQGKWQEAGQFCFFAQPPVHDLHGKRAGIFGRGELGQATGKLLEAVGMEVVYGGRKGVADPKPPYLPFDEVLATADVLTFHLPLMEETKHLIGREEFDKMARKPVVINTARGGIIHEMDLVEALENGKIRGAGMDVVTEEPPSAAHPFFKLARQPNFILTPHSAWASEEAMQILADQLIDNIEAFEQGKPKNLVSA